MPSPIGHSLAAYTIVTLTGTRVTRRRWTSALLLLLVANIADADMIAGLIVGEPKLYHRYHTHSVGAAVLAGLLVGAIGHRSGRRVVPCAALGIAVYGSHLLLDLLAADFSEPRGLQLLWPISSRFYLSPWTVFGEITTSDLTRLRWPKFFSPGNLASLAREVCVLSAIAIAARVARRRFARPPAALDL